MDQDLMILGDAGLDTKAGLGYTGRPDKYLSAVSRYYKNYEKNRAKVEEFLAAKDYENYMITVHALKSNSRMIGATDLGGMFETLEEAARSGDVAIIDDLTPKALSSYASLIEKIAFVEKLGETKAPDEISADEAVKIVGELLEALDDFDDERAKELAARLSGYPFRTTQADMLKEAAGHIDDFMYDEAAQIIKKIAPEIE